MIKSDSWEITFDFPTLSSGICDYKDLKSLHCLEIIYAHVVKNRTV